MPVNYAVQADVIDITHDNPRESDNFLVDSNVWLWLTYTKASASGTPAYQVRDYPNYLQKCLNTHSMLFWCGLSFAELAHQIEKTEREIFERANPGVTTKEFRHNHAPERSIVVSEVQAAWAQVGALGEPLNLTLDEPTTGAAVTRFSTQLLDGYDLFAIEETLRAGLMQILSDDGDFSTVPGVRLFTANTRVIAIAAQTGKLLRR